MQEQRFFDVDAECEERKGTFWDFFQIQPKDIQKEKEVYENKKWQVKLAGFTLQYGGLIRNHFRVVWLVYWWW